MSAGNLLIWLISICATGAVILRPFRWPEAVWAVGGALLLVVTGLLPADQALSAAARGNDVYLFLAGMMLLSELGRQFGVFDWLADWTLSRARGSADRLFLDLYLLGTLVTVFLSNDATAVVLTPAVLTVARKARVHPLPYLFACAMIANAASFVLPISNPANLVLYGGHTPALLPWLKHFLLPSLGSILATYLALRACLQLKDAPLRVETRTHLRGAGRLTLAGMLLTGVTLLLVSAADIPLGLPTCLMGLATTLVVLGVTRSSPVPILKEISWSVLPMVAGLFVLVQGLQHTGVVDALAGPVPALPPWLAGLGLALVCNLMNNLPAGLLAASVVATAHPGQVMQDSLLIGVDLGPNLAVTGSLATILWLTALRREGEHVTSLQFLRIGARVMFPALLLALWLRWLVG
ncbi:arsenic transporter [bacterium]|nr:arsenic transporter [bacterium]